MEPHHELGASPHGRRLYFAIAPACCLGRGGTSGMAGYPALVFTGTGFGCGPAEAPGWKPRLGLDRQPEARLGRLCHRCLDGPASGPLLGACPAGRSFAVADPERYAASGAVRLGAFPVTLARQWRGGAHRLHRLGRLLSGLAPCPSGRGADRSALSGAGAHFRSQATSAAGQAGLARGQAADRDRTEAWADLCLAGHYWRRISLFHHRRGWGDDDGRARSFSHGSSHSGHAGDRRRGFDPELGLEWRRALSWFRRTGMSKRLVVCGNGATAAALVVAMARQRLPLRITVVGRGRSFCGVAYTT